MIIIKKQIKNIDTKEFIKRNKQLLLILTLIVLIIIGIGYYLYTNYEDKNYEYWESDNDRESKLSNQTKKDVKEEIIIHITGQINKPGIVTLSEGDRVIDAINKAEGQTKEADLSKTNLAKVLEDGEKIYIPSTKDEEEQLTTTVQTSKTIKVNINTASETELEQIPGIGASTAARIVNYRKEKGKFKTIEGIKNVSGIGEAKFNSIKSYIYVK